MSDKLSELDLLMQSVRGGEEVEKVAEASEEVSEEAGSEGDVTKLAEDLMAGGEIMGNAMFDTVLAKIAGSGVPAAGGGSANPIAKPRSAWEEAAARLAKLTGRNTSIGDDTSVRAEQDGALHGSKSFKNSARALG